MRYTPRDAWNATQYGTPAIAPVGKVLGRYMGTVFATPLDPLGRSEVMEQTADQSALALAPNGGCGTASGTAYGALIGYDTTVQKDSINLAIDGGPQPQDDAMTYSYRKGQTQTIGFIPHTLRALPYLSGVTAGAAIHIPPYPTYPYTDPKTGITHAPTGTPDKIVRKPRINVGVDDKTIKVEPIKNVLTVVPQHGSIAGSIGGNAAAAALRAGLGIRIEGLNPPSVAPTVGAAAGSGLTASSPYAYCYLYTSNGGPSTAGLTAPTPPSYVPGGNAADWTAGYNAYLANAAESTNPHNGGTAAGIWWADGWQSALSNIQGAGATSGGTPPSGYTTVQQTDWNQGYAAYHSGKQPSDTPYSAGGTDDQAWQAGYQAGRSDAIEGSASAGAVSGGDVSAASPVATITTDSGAHCRVLVTIPAPDPLTHSDADTIKLYRTKSSGGGSLPVPTPPSSVSDTADWTLGYQAQQAGQPISSDPYNGATSQGIAWAQGWNQAQYDSLLAVPTPPSSVADTVDWQAGYAANNRGAAASTNPYVGGTPENIAWAAGFTQSQTDHLTANTAAGSGGGGSTVQFYHVADFAATGAVSYTDSTADGSLGAVMPNPTPLRIHTLLATVDDTKGSAALSALENTAHSADSKPHDRGLKVRADGTTITIDPTNNWLTATPAFGCNTTVDCAYSWEGTGTLDGLARSVFLYEHTFGGGDTEYVPWQVGTNNANNDTHGGVPALHSTHSGDAAFKALLNVRINAADTSDFPSYTGEGVFVDIDGSLETTGTTRLAQGAITRAGKTFEQQGVFVDIGGYLTVGSNLNATTTAHRSSIFTPIDFYGPAVFLDGMTLAGGAALDSLTASGLIAADSIHVTGTSTLTNDGRTDHKAMTAPATPAAGYTSLYSKTVSGTTKLYYKDSGGTEHDLASGSGGTVTSVALTAPSFLTVGGSPITGSGTLALTLATQTANTVFAGPTFGGAATPAFRGLTAADIPDLSSTYALAGTTGGSGADHLHGLARWVAGGGATFDLPDLAEYIEMTFDNGSAVDESTVTLSADRTQLVFDTAPTAGHVLQATYVIARI